MTYEVLEKLEGLLAEDQFELIDEEFTSDEKRDYRLVYLMNDATESFLVFKNARFTGIYHKDYDGRLDVILEKTEEGYALEVSQGKSSFTLNFEDLILENHFYNYGQVGHCWVKGSEHIRILEYQISIMRDKLDFLGESSCNMLEKKLAMLRDFPPLNQSTYPAVPEKYLVDRQDKWILTKEAASVMREIATEAGDRLLIEELDKYEIQQEGIWTEEFWQSRTRSFARLFQGPEHRDMLRLLANKIVEATKEYPVRLFPENEVKVHRQLEKSARERAKELESQGMQVMIYRQEPFYFARDSVEFQVFLIIIDKEGKVSTEIFENKE